MNNSGPEETPWPVCYLRQLLLRTANDVVLHLFRQHDPLSAVTCHTHHQILMLLRVFLRFNQGVAIDHVELDVHPFLIEVVTHQAAKVTQTILASQ